MWYVHCALQICLFNVAIDELSDLRLLNIDLRKPDLTSSSSAKSNLKAESITGTGVLEVENTRFTESTSTSIMCACACVCLTTFQFAVLTNLTMFVRSIDDVVDHDHGFTSGPSLHAVFYYVYCGFASCIGLDSLPSMVYTYR